MELSQCLALPRSPHTQKTSRFSLFLYTPCGQLGISPHSASRPWSTWWALLIYILAMFHICHIIFWTDFREVVIAEHDIAKDKIDWMGDVQFPGTVQLTFLTSVFNSMSNFTGYSSVWRVNGRGGGAEGERMRGCYVILKPESCFQVLKSVVIQ